MKDFIISIAIFIVLILFLPFIIIIFGKSVNNQPLAYATAAVQSPAVKNDISFNIIDTKTGAERPVPGFEFICSVVAAEVPASYNDEALKAQAVAAFSYCIYNKENLNDQIKTGVNVAYISKEDAKIKFGAAFEKDWQRIENAVRAVYGKAVFYNGKAADTFFFDMSSGATESGKNVFGFDEPYLVEVASSGDSLEKDLVSEQTVSLADFRVKAKSLFPKIDLGGSPENYISDIKRSSSGGIISAKLCGNAVTGPQLRELFSLRSANFTVSYTKSKFKFTVKGYGHGVGMSQRGAQYMALHGSDYEDILKWYYKGTSIGDYIKVNEAKIIAAKAS